MQLLAWIGNSLEMYKYELHAVAFPVFVHCFLDLVAKGFVDQAQAFLRRHAHDHTRLHGEEVRALGRILARDHLATNEYAQQVLHSKFNLHMSLLAFELLQTFLSQSRLFLLLALVNARVNLLVTTQQPTGMLVRDLDESLNDAVVTNMEPCESSRTFQSSDDIAQVVIKSDEPNESEIGVPLTSGAYDLEYMVHTGGGQGATLDDLHAIKVHWGVLPPRKVHVESADGDQNGSKEDGEGSGANGVAASGSGASGAGDAAANAGDGDKKSAASGDGASSAAGGSSKPGDKAKTGDKSAAGASAAGAAASDAQRKHKRTKLLSDGAHDKKLDGEVLCPLPDRKLPFHAEILEKIVLRQPAEMKAQALEDARTRAPVGKSQLPSALCFTFVNSSTHINNVYFSDDVTMVGASCDDGSFRVWRNDDQPLGTATGSVYNGDVGGGDHDNIVDEDEKTAVLRGHSSAVYGASFSPDNRFALTGSADSTVRLWSLAAKSNVVIYRSHASYPVWDVSFAPLGYYFASASMDRTARLWSTDHVTPLRIYAGHLSDVDCVQFHPNHHYLATGSSDKTVRLWDVQSGKCLRVFTGHFQGVKTLAFSRNGRYLASSGDDQYINIWDLHAGKRLETLIGHKGMVTSLAFSQEDAVLASGGMDSTVRLWDMNALADKPTVLPHTPLVPASAAVRPGEDGGNRFIKPLQMVRPSAMKELPVSRFLLQTLRSKQTPMYKVQFTPRNLLLCGGVFQPKMES